MQAGNNYEFRKGLSQSGPDSIADLNKQRRRKVMQKISEGVENIDRLNLNQLMRLAVRYHLGGLKLSDANALHLISSLKRKASEELEEGDGKKVETVRVEKRLGGQVVVFFGL